MMPGHGPFVDGSGQGEVFHAAIAATSVVVILHLFGLLFGTAGNGIQQGIVHVDGGAGRGPVPIDEGLDPPRRLRLGRRCGGCVGIRTVGAAVGTTAIAGVVVVVVVVLVEDAGPELDVDASLLLDSFQKSDHGVQVLLGISITIVIASNSCNSCPRNCGGVSTEGPLELLRRHVGAGQTGLVFVGLAAAAALATVGIINRAVELVGEQTAGTTGQ